MSEACPLLGLGSWAADGITGGDIACRDADENAPSGQRGKSRPEVLPGGPAAMSGRDEEVRPFAVTFMWPNARRPERCQETWSLER